jgi:hypothetical protein
MKILIEINDGGCNKHVPVVIPKETKELYGILE